MEQHHFFHLLVFDIWMKILAFLYIWYHKLRNIAYPPPRTSKRETLEDGTSIEYLLVSIALTTKSFYILLIFFKNPLLMRNVLFKSLHLTNRLKELSMDIALPCPNSNLPHSTPSNPHSTNLLLGILSHIWLDKLEHAIDDHIFFCVFDM